LNPHQRPEWIEMLDWLKNIKPFDILNPQEWVERLENCKDMDGHPALKLLGHWKQTFCGATETDNKTHSSFALRKTYRAAPILQAVQPVDEEYFRKIWFRLPSHVSTP
jgi:hypothetical protein